MSEKRDKLRRVWWPYCIERLGDRRYVLLNRRYKPLGISSRLFIRDYGPWSINLDVTQADAQWMSWNGSDDVSRIYFYNDGTIPTASGQLMEAYERRLTLLTAIGGPDLSSILHPSRATLDLAGGTKSSPLRAPRPAAGTKKSANTVFLGGDHE